MKSFLGVVGVLVLTAGFAVGQEGTRIYSRPIIPPREVLERLNLELAWRTVIPTDGRRDGLLDVRVLADQLVVQTYSGGVSALNPDDGSSQWRTRLGAPYRSNYLPAFNDRSVFIYNASKLYSLDRRTGRLEWELAPLHAPTATAGADNDRVFLTQVGGRLDVFDIPGSRRSSPGAKPFATPAASVTTDASLATGALPTANLETAISPSGSGYAPPAPIGSSPDPNRRPGALPQFSWTFEARNQVDQAPLISSSSMVTVDSAGEGVGTLLDSPQVQFRFQIDASPSAPAAQFGDVAYIPSLDFRLYAVHLITGNVLWRFTASGPVKRRPAVTEEDIYITANGGGLYRLGRASGEEVWHNANADQFLAANPKFVYAIDRSGRLLVLDRARGNLLSFLDVRDYVVPVTNEATDRLYLASNDGLIICLHDRSYPTPLLSRNPPEKVAAPGKPAVRTTGKKEPPPGEDKGNEDK